MIARAAMTVFHGPKVESSFSEMANIMDKKRGRMDARTYHSYQVVRYYLRAKKTTTVKLFWHDDNQYSPVDKALCYAIRQAAKRNKARLAKARAEKELKQVLYGVDKAVTSTAQKKLLKKNAERSFLLHQLKMKRQAAMKRLAKSRSSGGPARRRRQPSTDNW